MPEFELDETLATVAIAICDLPLCSVRLMRDGRWPWLMLVPRIANLSEWYELDTAQQEQASREIALVSRVLKDLSGCEKINVGALGNMVRQMHIHVIARSTGDANWPGPVWGFGEPRPRTDAELAEWRGRVRDALGA